MMNIRKRHRFMTNSGPPAVVIPPLHMQTYRTRSCESTKRAPSINIELPHFKPTYGSFTRLIPSQIIYSHLNKKYPFLHIT